MKNFLLALLIFLAVGARFYYFWYPFGRSSEVTIDEAVYGVQATRIMEGDRPVFYPAQDYTGSFSAYLSAALFAIFGAGSAVLKVVPLLFSAGTVLVIYYLAHLTLGSRVATFSLFITALGTPFWNNWSSRAGTGYVEATFLGGVILVLAYKFCIAGQVPLSKNFFILGLLSGLGFWIQPTIVYTILPALVFLILNLGFFRMVKQMPLFIVGLLLGGAPVLYYNLFIRVSATTNALLKIPWGVRGSFIKLVTQGFPVLLGGRTANSLIDFNLLVSGLIYSLFFIALVLFLKRAWGKWRGGEFLLSLTFIIILSVFLISTPFNQLSIEPRYVYSLYLIIPIVLGSFLSLLWQKNRVWLLVVVLVYLINFYFGLLKAGPLSFVDNYSFTPLVGYLKDNKISYVITTPAVGHRIMFFSKGLIKAQVRGGGITQARFERVNEEVTRARDIEPRLVAYVNLVGETEQQSFTNELRAIVGDNYLHEIVDGVFNVVLPRP